MTQTSDIKKLFGLFAGISKKLEALDNNLSEHITQGMRPGQVVAPKQGDPVTVVNMDYSKVEEKVVAAISDTIREALEKNMPLAFGLPSDPPVQKRPTPIWPAYDEHVRVGALYVDLHQPCKQIQGLRQSLSAQDVDAILECIRSTAGQHARWIVYEDAKGEYRDRELIGKLERRREHMERLIKVFRGGFK